jgi:hypothetical protein
MKRTSDERLRAVAQILIEEIGADGPKNAEMASAEAVQLIRSLKCEVAVLRGRLQFDPDGPDKIDELEQSIQFREHNMGLVVEKVKTIQAHIEGGGANEELTAATVLCSEIIASIERG